MKLLTIFTFIFFIQYSNAQQDSLYLSPSVFYTYGDYNVERSSSSLAFYNTLQLTDNLFLVNHYEHLTIESSEWKYLQQAFLGGLYADFFPFYAKFYYSHYKGDFDYKPFTFEYSDFTNLYSFGMTYYTSGYYLGGAYTFLNQIGFKQQVSHQISIQLEKILSYDIFISLKPIYTNLSDGRELYGASVKMHYLAAPDLLLKAGGFAGERAYFFDTDLLTIFNQDDTQKYQFFLQAEYSLIPQIKLILAYQKTGFSSFDINYFIAGIKSSLYL